jgi:hypothetical protein
MKRKVKKENENTSVIIIMTSHLVAIRCVMFEEQKKEWRRKEFSNTSHK